MYAKKGLKEIDMNNHYLSNILFKRVGQCNEYEVADDVD